MNKIKFILILFILTSFSCKRTPQQKEEEHYGPYYFDSFANYFWFKPGSYWIYENNRTLELDTCTLVAMRRDTITLYGETNWKKRWYTMERIDYDIYTRHRLGIVNYRTTLPCLDCPQVNSNKAIERNGERNVFYLPWNTYPQNSAYLGNFNIGSSNYSEVYRFDLQSDGGLPFWDDTKLLWGGQNGSAQFSSYYWAKDFGLVQIKYKKTLDTGLDSAFWTLKDYNLIKY